MDRTVLYLQMNKEEAQAVKNKLQCEDIEVYIASTAKEALAIMSEKDIMVAVADCYIQDMKLLDFIKASIKAHPDTMLNICVDAPGMHMIANFSDIKQVKKIYIEPWDLEEIFDGIMATLNQVCIDRDMERRRISMKEDAVLFETSVNRLKEALMKQRYSYHRLEKILTPYLDASIAMTRESIDNKEMKDSSFDIYSKFIRQCCMKMLQVMTTIKLETDVFADQFTEDINAMLPKSGRIQLENVSSCIIGNPERDKLASVFYCLWVIVYYQCYRIKNGTINIDSYFTDASVAHFEITVDGKINDMHPELISEYVDDVISILCVEYNRDESDDSAKYMIDFQMR